MSWGNRVRSGGRRRLALDTKRQIAEELEGVFFLRLRMLHMTSFFMRQSHISTLGIGTNHREI